MADEKQPGSGFGGNNLVLLAVAAASAVYLAWQKPPLEALRPTEVEPQIHYASGVQDVDARLWQDPFGAVAQYIDAHQELKGAQAPAHDISGLGDLRNTLVLGVTLPGGTSAVKIEERRRLRYGVLAALHTEEYMPADAEHIGYLHIESSGSENNSPPTETLTASAGPIDAGSAVTADNLPSLRIDIPFEWFDSVARDERSQAAPRIVVMWLDEAALDQGRRPIGHLERLAGTLNLGQRGHLTVIGPHDSTTLTSMVQEIESSGGQPRSGAPLLSMYNFAATADDEAVLRRVRAGAHKPPAPHSNGEDVESLFLEKAGIRYYRSITPDKVLATALVEELKRRGVNPGRTVQRRAEDDIKSVEIHPDHIALISEWDSVYGQTLPEVMSEAFDADAEAHGARTAVRTKSILRFSYLRGLDGRLPNRRPPADGKSSNESNAGGESANQHSKGTVNTARELEVAKGQGQFDYLRRLADHIHERDLQLQQRGEGKIAAIGVLASDVYDKLLILQALKPTFPGALFFTTDLDALLLSGSKSEYARNLIVASGFDLRLQDAVQEDVPPFRSAYQTSVFLSTRLAVQNARNPAREAETRTVLKRWLHEARLFEISRTGPLPLPADIQDTARDGEDAGRGGQGSCTADILDCGSVMPQAASLFPTLKSGSLVSAGLLGAILLFCALLSSRALRQLCLVQNVGSAGLPQARPTRIVWITLVGVVAMSASFGLCSAWPALAAFLTQHGAGEPMALFEGVSVWPTILLRAAGFGLSLWLICHTVQSLQANLHDTETEMRLRTPHFWFLRRPYLRGRGRSCAGRLIETLSLSWFHGRTGCREWSPDNDERPRVPILYLSVRYTYYGRTGWRFCRAGVATLAMFVLWCLLSPIFGEPNAPIRGQVTASVYKLVSTFDVFATLFLIFLVADATLYSRSFVKQLTAIRSEWPKRTVDHFKNMLGLDPANLDDWIDIQFLVKRTKFITTLIYFPALMLALLVISRSPVFDSYTVTPTLVVAQAISVIVIIGSVFSLRRAAERAREAAVNHLTDKIIAAKGPSGDGKLADQLEMLLGRIQNLREGAFAPLSSQPIVKAVLLPLLSYGGTVLMQMYALPG